MKKGNLTQKALLVLSDLFDQYQKSVANIKKASNWFDVIAQTTHDQQLHKIAKAIKYTKGPSVEKRTGEIFDLLNQNNLINGYKRDRIFDVCRWQPINFQIKKLGNDTRMALKNYFLPNDNVESVQKEIDKTNGGVVVVFDDNVSGGATLSDICMQLKNLGIEYIIPITFGKMRTSYNQGMNLTINKPETGFNYM
jgi:predicted amidophosphoribosyltransferase